MHSETYQRNYTVCVYMHTIEKEVQGSKKSYSLIRITTIYFVFKSNESFEKYHINISYVISKNH